MQLGNKTYSYLMITLFMCFGFTNVTGLKSKYIDPTGTYGLANKLHPKSKATGDIQIKSLSKNKLVIVLGVNMGPPAYNSGALIDTLTYNNNSCVFNGDIDDPTCKITFAFTKAGIIVTQKQADINSGCGFGHGVFADGYYKKESSKAPTLKHPQTGQLIK